MTREVVFICIFNINRSVIAEHFFRRLLQRKSLPRGDAIIVSSAGFMGKNVEDWFVRNSIPIPEPLFGRSPSDLIQALLLERGIDVSLHRSRSINAELLDTAHTLIPLLEILKDDLIQAFPHFRKKMISPRGLTGKREGFFWEDQHAVPNDHRMYDFAHGNREYVSKIICEIEQFIDESFDDLVSHVLSS
jgi:protein-tyrosine-phosphatase